MSYPSVCSGALLHCTFGIAPSILNVLPANRILVNNMPMANIQDNKPFVNILPFGMCTCIANPTVAAATAAALGVLTPMPCIPATSAPWIPGSPTVLAGNMPALTSQSMLMCSWGGMIKINVPGQFTTILP
ncbi:hypothetical protein TUM12370_06590 [Salmonella enterica subsp. enterica serovar Choleraesuis]|nr:hypothetical protein TUM12370_06590 [Salmonella enterica subsp. enterica serovar Choleraesuis]